MRTFYRVCNQDTLQGLWYDFQGNFTGHIHDRFNFCLHRELKMDFDEELCGYLSATDNLDTLYNWFPKQDILQLQKHGYFIYEFETDDYKFYNRFQHWVISQRNSVVTKKIILL